MALHKKQKQQLQQGVKLQLSPKEIEVATTYALVGNSTIVAQELHLSIKTIHSHMEGITRKLKVKGIVEAIALLADSLQFPPLPEIKTCEITPKQLEALEWLRVGKSNAEIAQKMGVTIRTVEDYVSAILNRSKLKNRCQLMLYSRLYAEKFVNVNNSKKAKIINLKASGVSVEAIAQRVDTSIRYVYNCK